MIVESIWQFFFNILQLFVSNLICFCGEWWILVFSTFLTLSVCSIFFGRSLLELGKRLKQVNKLPGPQCTSWILGNIPFDVVWNSLFRLVDHRMIIINLMQSVLGYSNVYRQEKIFRIWLSWEPLVFLWHPDTAEKVLSNNFLLEKSAQYKFLHPWLGTGLLTSDGAKWRTRRKLLVPAFHFKILNDFVPVFNDQAKVLIHRLRRVARQKCSNCTVVDIVPIITACTLDIICETIMGVSIDAQNTYNNKYCQSVNEVGECFLERLVQPQLWSDQVFYRSASGERFSTNLIRLHDFTRKVIRDRKQELSNTTNTIRYRRNGNGEYAELEEQARNGRKAFLDLLLDHHINSGELSEEDIREEVDTFMFEGHDTTAMALSWILFLLGHHPEIQARAAAEVDILFDELDDSGLDGSTNSNQNSLPWLSSLKPSTDNDASDLSSSHDDDGRLMFLDLDKIKSLKYLDCCVKEGLRLCPSVPLIGRRLHDNMSLNGYHIPKDTILFVNIFMLHRDPDVFPKPESFDPDRFMPENSQGRHPYAFVPFSAGPRNCIGQRFAMTELKVVLAYLLRYFRFESLDSRDKILAMMEMVYRPKSPLRLRVFERRKSEFNGVENFSNLFEQFKQQTVTSISTTINQPKPMSSSDLNVNINTSTDGHSLVDLGPEGNDSSRRSFSIISSGSNQSLRSLNEHSIIKNPATS